MKGRRGPLFSVLLAVGAAVVYVFAAGYFLVRANALTHGVIVGWGLQIEAITQPGPPVLQQAAILLISALLVYPFVKAMTGGQNSSSTSLIGQPAAAATVLIAVTGWAFMTSEYPHSGGLDSVEPVIVTVAREAGLSPAIHATSGVLLMLVLLVLTRDTFNANDDDSSIDHPEEPAGDAVGEPGLGKHNLRND